MGIFGEHYFYQLIPVVVRELAALGLHAIGQMAEFSRRIGNLKHNTIHDFFERQDARWILLRNLSIHICEVNAVEDLVELRLVRLLRDDAHRELQVVPRSWNLDVQYLVYGGLPLVYFRNLVCLQKLSILIEESLLFELFC